MELAGINLHRRILKASEEDDIYSGIDIYQELPSNSIIYIALAVAAGLAALVIIMLLIWHVERSRLRAAEMAEAVAAAAERAASAERAAAAERAVAQWAAAAAAAQRALEAERKKRPMAVYRLGRDGAADECTICLENLVEGEKIPVLPQCHHRFHVGCIDKWLVSNDSCPNCRISLLQPQHHVINF